MDSAILTDKSLSSRLVLKETYCAVQWKGLFPVDNVIHFSNNWDQVYKWDQCTVPLEHMGERGGGGGRKKALASTRQVSSAVSKLTITITIIFYYHSKQIFLSLSGREPTTWPANNCLQIMVCSCAMPSNCVWLQIIFCTCVKETVLFSFLRSLLSENGRSPRFPKIFIKKTNLVIEW